MRVGTRTPAPRVTRVAALALGMTIAACGGPPSAGEDPSERSAAAAREAASDSAGEAAVRAVLASYYEALSDRDWSRFADHFWPEADLTTVWTPPGEPTPRVDVTSVSAFVAQAPEGPDSRSIFEERMLSAAVNVEGGLAQAWVHYRARFGDPGDIAEWEGIDAVTLMRHDGVWRIVGLAYVGG